MKNWKWFGHAAHFSCGSRCQFHLATQVGKYLVSTVGELWLERSSREVHAQVHDPKWLEKNRHLKDDYFDSAYMARFGFEEIGCNRKYETMVFKAGKPCRSKECGCGLLEIDGSELDFLGYNNVAAAAKGHLKLCRKWGNQK